MMDTNKALISSVAHEAYIRINHSSIIKNVEIKGEHFEINYYDSPFDEEVDGYKFVNFALEDISDFININGFTGYTFYGKFYSEKLDKNILLFGKQISREKVNRGDNLVTRTINK